MRVCYSEYHGVCRGSDGLWPVPHKIHQLWHIVGMAIGIKFPSHQNDFTHMEIA